MTIWVYTIICTSGLWCIPEYNITSSRSYPTEEACYAAAGSDYSYRLDHGWVAVCISGRKWSPTADKHYGCNLQNQAPNGECR